MRRCGPAHHGHCRACRAALVVGSRKSRYNQDRFISTADANATSRLIRDAIATVYVVAVTAVYIGIAVEIIIVVNGDVVVTAPAATIDPTSARALARFVEVTAKVTNGVICVFHASVTFQPCEWRSTFLEAFESDTSKRPRKWKSSIKMFPSDLRETVTEYIHGRRPTQCPLLTREPPAGKKVRKNFNLSEGHRLEDNDRAQPPIYLFKEHPDGKK